MLRRYLAKTRLSYQLWAIAVPLGLTVVEWPFRERLTPSNILMFYLLGVFFVAIRFGFWPSVLASMTCAGAFAFFFAPPIFSFAISEPENLIGLIVMLVVGTVTSNLADNVRHQAEVAEQGERRASALYRLSKELAEARLERDIIEIGIRHIHNAFSGHSTLLIPDGDGRLGYPAEAPLNLSYRGADLTVARSVLREGQMEGRDTERSPGKGAIYLPINGSHGAAGVLVLEPADISQIFLPEQQQFLDSLADQIVHALERTRLAEQAREATLRMQAETLRNSLLSSISHDLRTPLATIVGAATSLETDTQGLDESSKRKLAGVISEEAQRMSDLTTKILEMARLEAGEVALNRQWCTPEEIIGSALRRLDKKLKNREIRVQIADGQALIQVDVVLLQQVLVNLLDNADKYSSPALPIGVVVDTMPHSLSITVADRGQGIPEEFRQKVFDKFFRIHAESAQSGVGLGLSICRAIVEAHGGEIHAASRDGGGTIFQVHLPLLESPPLIEAEELGQMP